CVKKRIKREFSVARTPQQNGVAERKIQDINVDPLVSLVRESMKEKSTDFVTPIKASGEAHRRRNQSYNLRGN
ncbi:putative ribonuclease H-like domain-containing protein, partial [Tanacetum coccineum]